MVAIKHKVPGATLVETLIAITILVVCFTMATMIVLNVTKSANRFERVTAYLLLQKVANDSKLEYYRSNETLSFKHITIQKEITPTSYSKNILQLELKAIDRKNRTLCVYHDLILVKDEQLVEF